MKKIFLFIAFASSFLMAEEPQTNNFPHAIFAGGCFWCIQPFFDQTPGVISATVGYTGGHVRNPTYEQVCSETTGHREAIDVVYDPAKVSYEKLLDVYWRSIDPTDAGGQFYDRGESYTTAIFYTTPEQQKAAELSKQEVEKEFSPKPVYTKILPAGPFYPAESYQQEFYKKSPGQFNSYKAAAGHDEKLEDLWKDKQP